MKNFIIACLTLGCVYFGGKEYGRNYLDGLYKQTLVTSFMLEVETFVLIREFGYESDVADAWCLSAEDSGTRFQISSILQAAEVVAADAQWYAFLQRTFYKDESQLQFRTLVLSNSLVNARAIVQRLDNIHFNMLDEDVLEYCITTHESVLGVPV